VDADVLATVIMVLGAPRSGTTWLAKIIDSHPDVLYRHEPDESRPPRPDDTLQALLAEWADDRSPRTTTKRPFFAKSFRPGWARILRIGLAAASSAASRLPPPLSWVAECQLPELINHPAPRLLIKSVRWAKGAENLARSVPGSRIVFILRHPCGQVASVIRGARQRRFDLKTEGTDMPFDEDAATAFAAARGLDPSAFQALPDAAKYAWSWRAFNEPAYAALAPQPNVNVVLYEALCARPEALARRILAFAALDWNLQTEDFIARSAAHEGRADYYAIFRDAVASAEAWRTALPATDQQAVRSVVSASPLARFWPDLVGQPA
jgi:hypothetical protein